MWYAIFFAMGVLSTLAVVSIIALYLEAKEKRLMAHVERLERLREAHFLNSPEEGGPR
jgi:hypothetical protein